MPKEDREATSLDGGKLISLKPRFAVYRRDARRKGKPRRRWLKG